MKVEPFDVYSDHQNKAVVQHPGHKFPAVLIRGDNLYSLCAEADRLCVKLRSGDDEAHEAANHIRNALWSYLTHYKQVLGEHGIRLPFSEQPEPK